MIDTADDEDLTHDIGNLSSMVEDAKSLPR